MKRFIFVLAALGLVAGFNACERQDWEETRKLHLKHEGHHDKDGEGGGEAEKH